MPPKPTKAPAAEYYRIFNHIIDPSAENAKAADVREFFRQLFKDQFLYEANADYHARGIAGERARRSTGRQRLVWVPRACSSWAYLGRCR